MYPLQYASPLAPIIIFSELLKNKTPTYSSDARLSSDLIAKMKHLIPSQLHLPSPHRAQPQESPDSPHLSPPLPHLLHPLHHRNRSRTLHILSKASLDPRPQSSPFFAAALLLPLTSRALARAGHYDQRFRARELNAPGALSEQKHGKSFQAQRAM